MNKYFILPVLLVLIFIQTSFSQITKVLDSNVNWGSKTLTLYLSDSGNVSSVEISLGTSLDATDIYHQTLSVGSGITPTGDQLLADLSSVTPGTYYVDLKVTLLDASVKEMQYQTPAQ